MGDGDWKGIEEECVLFVGGGGDVEGADGEGAVGEGGMLVSRIFGAEWLVSIDGYSTFQFNHHGVWGTE